MADERESPFGYPVSVPCRGTEEKGPLPPFPKAPRHEAEGTGKAVSPELGPDAAHVCESGVADCRFHGDNHQYPPHSMLVELPGVSSGAGRHQNEL